jgi:hypothetical protein
LPPFELTDERTVTETALSRSTLSIAAIARW